MPVRPARRHVIIGLGATLAFAYSLHASGWTAVVDSLARVGFGFGLIVAVSSVRPAARALAWSVVSGRRALSFGKALQAQLIGDALGSLSPLGPLVSEPAKVMLATQQIDAADAIAATGIENVIYSLSVMAVVAAGAVGLGLAVGFPASALRLAAGLAGVAIAATGAVIWLVVTRVGPVAQLVARPWVARWIPPSAGPLVDGALAVERRIAGFARRAPGRLLAALVLEVVFHVSAVAETYVTLAMLTNQHPSLFAAFGLEAVNRATTVAFKFVPFRFGVDEASMGLVAPLVRQMAPTGVALALVRRARVVAWTGVGLGILACDAMWLRRRLRAHAPSGPPARS